MGISLEEKKVSFEMLKQNPSNQKSVIMKETEKKRKPGEVKFEILGFGILALELIFGVGTTGGAAAPFRSTCEQNLTEINTGGILSKAEDVAQHQPQHNKNENESHGRG